MKQTDLGTDLYNGTITGGIALEGNGARPSHQGVGWSDKGVMFTLNAVEQHSVLDLNQDNPHKQERLDTNRTFHRQ